MIVTLKALWSILLLCTSNWSLVTCEETQEKWGTGHVFKNLQQDPGTLPDWDNNGYVFFCLCMGRFGNQVDHLLGGMAFAKSLNRTLVIPPFRTYRNVRFTEWFKLEPVQRFHKAVLAEDFMEHYAESHWPAGERLGFCWKPSKDIDPDCKMKDGNPFGPFWDGLGVDFDGSHVYRITYHEIQKWQEEYPPDKYPVLAMRGAPARFPVHSDHREIQKYLVFSDFIQHQAQEYVDLHFPGKTYVGIHLRNGADWYNACSGLDKVPKYMASPQCLENTGKYVTKDLCFPTDHEVLRLTKLKVLETQASVVFVATDKRPMIAQLEEHLSQQNVKVYHADPHLPVVDLAILVNSDHFIGNCVSSFTAFVKRARDVTGKPSSFFSFS